MFMKLLSVLNKEQKEKLQKIWDTDYHTIVSGKDNGVPFLKYVFELHYKLFGEVCSNCPNKISSYIQQIKNLKSNSMKTTNENLKDFKLNEGVAIPIPGTSKSYSNSNLTDEIAIELLAKNKNRKSLFAKTPKNLDKLIEDYNSKTEVPKGDSTLVKIGEKEISVETTIEILKAIGINTRATTVSGLEKVISALTADKLAEIEKTLVTPAPLSDKSKEELQFDLEKALQDLNELEAEPEKNKEAIEDLKNVIESLEEKLK